MGKSLSLAEINERLEKLGFVLDGEYVGTTQKPTPLRCSKGHRWNGRISSVFSGVGCPQCAGRVPLEEIDRRLSVRGFERAGPYVGTTQKPTPLRCAQGHVWKARITKVLTQGTGCPHCYGNAAIDEEGISKRLAALGIELAEPYTGTTHLNTKLRCLYGHEWYARASNIFHKNYGCPHCSGVAKYTVEEVDEHLAIRGFFRTGPYSGSVATPTPLRCLSCGHEREARLTDILQGNGCPACARDPWRTQSIYHLHHPDIPHAYIGISTKPLVRLEEHQQDGGPRGDLARSIDEPELLTNADVFAFYEAAWEEDRLPETIANWFESNPHGKLPPGRLWFTDWFAMDAKERRQPAKVPRFVAEWVETEMIRVLSENFPARDNPFLQAGKVPLVNIAKNSVAALSC